MSAAEGGCVHVHLASGPHESRDWCSAHGRRWPCPGHAWDGSPIAAPSPAAAALAEMRPTAAEDECEHHSWAGLMALLDEHWPDDIFPTREDDITRDAGARIVSLIRWVDRLRAALSAPLAGQHTTDEETDDV